MFNGLGGGCDSISIGWMGVNTTRHIGGGVGGSRYHIGIPNMKLGKLRASMTSLLTVLDGGKRKGIMWIENGPQ